MVNRALRRSLQAAAVLLFLLLCGGALSACILSHPLPIGAPGPAADALAHSIEQAVNLPAWQQTGAVHWRFAGKHDHLWDRRRGLARIEWNDAVVLLHTRDGQGKAFRKGQALDGEEASQLVKKAYAYWMNDSFWLNPLAKLFDNGVSRSLVDHEGHPALLIHYASGGVTPGDTYLWILDENNRPRAWRLWVQIIRIKGLQISWEGWTQLPTGAWISTAHKVAGLNVPKVDELQAASSLSELMPGADPFALLSP